MYLELLLLDEENLVFGFVPLFLRQIVFYWLHRSQHHRLTVWDLFWHSGFSWGWVLNHRVPPALQLTVPEVSFDPDFLE